MSDFFNSGWSYFIAIISIVGIVFCLWLLLSQRKNTVAYKADGTVADTGHEWDGLRELNNPLPSWWMWMFLISIIFGVAYLYLYPGMGSYPGSLGFTSAKEHSESVVKANAELKPFYEKYGGMSMVDLAKDPQANQIGQRLYLNYCAQCHGADAGGGKGFPTLNDKDWLYGGDPDNIKTTITQGRQGNMPSFKSILSAGDINNVVNYVRSLSGLPSNAIKRSLGEVVFKNNCIGCHGPEGKGNTIIGAPNLTDKVWLYGGSEATITETLLNGRNGKMPAHNEILTPERIHLLTAYIWGLSQ